MKKYRMLFTAALVAAFTCVAAAGVRAQQPYQPPGQAQEAPAPRVPFRDTLLFSPAELSALREAAAGQRTSTAGLQSETDKVDLIPIDRKIRLGGVFKRDDSDFWILWMNGHKLHPGYLFPEIQKIKVEKEEVYLEWYDIGLNDVIKLTMRPNQVYDIVTGILYNDTAGGR